MNQLARFWVIILALAVCVTAFTYLFLSFFFPDPEVVQTAPEVRIGATLSILLFGSVFIWATLFVSLDEGEPVGGTEETDDVPDKYRL